METVILTTPWGSLESFAGDLITDQLSEYGAHQRSDLALLLSLLQPGDTAIDVGAHIGSYTIPITRAVGPAGQVIAIEPLEEHYALLQRNLERNGLTDRVQTIRALAGGEANFLGANSGNTGSARFGRKGGDLKVKFPVVKLDDVAPSGVALVKIDVEGMEAEVLRSARELLRRDRPIVVFETGTGSDVREVVSQFAGLDYSFLVNLHQRSGQEDIFETGRLPNLSSRSLASRLVLPLPLLDVVSDAQRFEPLAGIGPICLRHELSPHGPKDPPEARKTPAVHSVSARNRPLTVEVHEFRVRPRRPGIVGFFEAPASGPATSAVPIDASGATASFRRTVRRRPAPFFAPIGR